MQCDARKPKYCTCRRDLSRNSSSRRPFRASGDISWGVDVHLKRRINKIWYGKVNFKINFKVHFFHEKICSNRYPGRGLDA